MSDREIRQPFTPPQINADDQAALQDRRAAVIEAELALEDARDALVKANADLNLTVRTVSRRHGMTGRREYGIEIDEDGARFALVPPPQNQRGERP